MHPKPLLFLTFIAIGFYQLTALVATTHPVSGSILGYASNITVIQVIESTNGLRSGSGIGTLRYNEQLSRAAVAKAQNMFSEGYWAHTSPSGREPWDFIKSSGYRYRIAGENLARDFDSTSPMMDAWMNSPTHRANIMNPRYEEIGVAVVDGLLNGIETTLVVQMFGTPEVQAVTQEQKVVVPAVASSTTQNEPPKETAVPFVALQTETEQSDVEEVLESEEQIQVQQTADPENTDVLAETVVPQGLLSDGILYSPQHILKAFFLSIILIVLVVLLYDAFVAGHKNSVRLVGKNLAHIMFFVTILYLIIAFKGGVVGP